MRFECEYGHEVDVPDPGFIQEFEGFRAGMYQAASMTRAPTGVLIKLAVAKKRAEVITIYNNWFWSTW